MPWVIAHFWDSPISTVCGPQRWKSRNVHLSAPHPFILVTGQTLSKSPPLVTFTLLEESAPLLLEASFCADKYYMLMHLKY